MCEVEAMDKTAEDVQDPTRQHNGKILYWYFKNLRENSKSGFVPVKFRNEASISDKESIKERYVEYLVNVLNCDKVSGNLTEKSEKVVEDLFCKEESETALKGLNINNNTSGADIVVNEFLLSLTLPCKINLWHFRSPPPH